MTNTTPTDPENHIPHSHPIVDPLVLKISIGFFILILVGITVALILQPSTEEIKEQEKQESQAHIDPLVALLGNNNTSPIPEESQSPSPSSTPEKIIAEDDSKGLEEFSLMRTVPVDKESLIPQEELEKRGTKEIIPEENNITVPIAEQKNIPFSTIIPHSLQKRLENNDFSVITEESNGMLSIDKKYKIVFHGKEMLNKWARSGIGISIQGEDLTLYKKIISISFIRSDYKYEDSQFRGRIMYLDPIKESLKKYDFRNGKPLLFADSKKEDLILSNADKYGFYISSDKEFISFKILKNNIIIEGFYSKDVNSESVIKFLNSAISNIDNFYSKANKETGKTISLPLEIQLPEGVTIDESFVIASSGETQIKSYPQDSIAVVSPLDVVVLMKPGDSIPFLASPVFEGQEKVVLTADTTAVATLYTSTSLYTEKISLAEKRDLLLNAIKDPKFNELKALIIRKIKGETGNGWNGKDQKKEINELILFIAKGIIIRTKNRVH